MRALVPGDVARLLAAQLVREVLEQLLEHDLAERAELAARAEGR